MSKDSQFPDTGPQENGTRTASQWINAMAEDAKLARTYVLRTVSDEVETQEDRTVALALAIKEINRLRSDIYRYGDEIFGITREDIDSVRT